MGIDWSEFQPGLARTWPYLLSHHLPSEHHRCYAPTIFGRQIHICARCLGIYPGILAVLVAAVLEAGFARSSAGLAIILVFPLPALVDWTLTAFTERRGHNVVRTITGLLLGYGYGTGLNRLFLAGDLRVLAVGTAYALAAGSLLYLSTIDGETER